MVSPPGRAHVIKKKTDTPVVADVMTQVVVTVSPETTIPELVALLTKRHFSGAPVVSKDGRILGVVSSSDVLRLESHEEAADYYSDDEWSRGGSALDAGANQPRTVLDIATRKVVTLDEQTALPEAAKVLLELGIRRVLVTRNGQFAGILTATDVLKWVARPALEAAAAD
jgi:CBS domain-containing protein